jgi:hypothetical protein
MFKIIDDSIKSTFQSINLTNRLIRKCKTLGREQRKRYIELGKYCEECQTKNDDSSDEEVIDSDTEDKK